MGYAELKELEILAQHKKLSLKFAGPFLVFKEINKVAFKLLTTGNFIQSSIVPSCAPSKVTFFQPNSPPNCTKLQI